MSDRIDAWTHIFPQAYFARLKTMATAAGPLKRWLELACPPRPRHLAASRSRPDAGLSDREQVALRDLVEPRLAL